MAASGSNFRDAAPSLLFSHCETTRAIHEDIELQIQNAISELSTELQSRKSLIQRDTIVKERVKQISSNITQLRSIYNDQTDVFKSLLQQTIHLPAQKAFHKFDAQARDLLYQDLHASRRNISTIENSMESSGVFRQMADFETLFTSEELSGKALDLVQFHHKFTTLLIVALYNGYTRTNTPQNAPDLTHETIHNIIHPLKNSLKSFSFKDFLQYFDDLALLIPAHVKQAASAFVLNEYCEFLSFLKDYLLLFLFKINPLLDQDEIDSEIRDEYTTLQRSSAILGWNEWDKVVNYRQSKEYGILLVNYPEFNIYSTNSPPTTLNQYNTMYTSFINQQHHQQQQRQSTMSDTIPDNNPTPESQTQTQIKTEIDSQPTMTSTNHTTAPSHSPPHGTTTTSTDQSTTPSQTPQVDQQPEQTHHCVPCEKTLHKLGPYTAHLHGKKHAEMVKKYNKKTGSNLPLIPIDHFSQPSTPPTPSTFTPTSQSSTNQTTPFNLTMSRTNSTNPTNSTQSQIQMSATISANLKQHTFLDTLKNTRKEDTSAILATIKQHEFYIGVIADLLRAQITFTIDRYDRKRVQTTTEAMMDDVESGDDEIDPNTSNIVIIDPKTGLPIQTQSGVVIAADGTVNTENKLMTPDGRIIPAWLYKLHSFHMTYSCEICGGDIHRGERNFKLHFKDYKHTYMLKCLGIANSDLFVDVAKINDAMDLHDKLQKRQIDQASEQVEEIEDVLGNVSTRRM